MSSDRLSTGRILSPILDYIGLALLILLPLLGPGYVLIEDMVFVPHISLVSANNPLFPLMAVLHIMNRVLPAWFIQKIILMFILISAGWGAHRLAGILGVRRQLRYFAGVAYVINPFVYDRLMYGQWGILLAYSVLPLAIAELLTLRSLPRSIALGALWAVMCAFESQMMVIGSVIVLAAVVVNGLGQHWRALRYLGIFVMSWCLGSAYWVLPTLVGSSPISAGLRGISTLDLAAFSAAPDHTVGLWLTLLNGYGFWAEQSGRYLLAKQYIPGWWVLGVLLATLSLIGVVGSRENRHDSRRWFLLGLGLCGLILAAGSSTQPIASLTRGIVTIFPIYRGLRDSTKWLVLPMLAYAILGACGLDMLTERLIRISRLFFLHRIGVLFILLPVLGTPTIFWAANGQLQLSHYPASWFAARRYLQATLRPNTNALFLPWHLYMSFPFSHRVVIANPAASFFPRTIAGDNLEVRGIPSESPSTRSRVLLRAFRLEYSSGLASQAIRQFRICAVLVVTTADWKSDMALLRTVVPALTIVQQTPDLVVFHSTAAMCQPSGVQIGRPQKDTKHIR